MDQQKWKETLGMIKESFEVEDNGSEHSDEYGGIDTEYVVFQGPIGKMRLEFITKPVVLDKQTTYSRRIGSETTVEYIYSPDEKIQKLMVYTWSDEKDDWIEVDSDSLNL